MIRHPDHVALQRFGDGEADGGRAQRVAHHLESCERCRREISAVRALRDAARNAAVPAIAVDAWTRIATRRRDGARVLLPVDGPPLEPVRPRWMVATVASSAIAAAAVIAILLTRGLGASPTGVLSIQPGRPRPGAEITLHYRPTAALADERRLVVRAGFMRAEDETWAIWEFWSYYAARPSGHEVGVLTRNGDGSFSGAIRIPDSAVYALLAIEDPSGERVDTNAGRLWDVVTAAPDGRPSFLGLRARAARGGRATSARGEAAADTLVKSYPDSAQSWALQLAWQGSSRIPHWLHVFDLRERRFALLNAQLGSRTSVSAAEAMAMVSLATAIEDSAGVERWRSRLIAEHPTDVLAILALADRVASRSPAAAQRSLPEIEAAWPAPPGATPLLADAGLRIAARSGDPAAIRTWTVRRYRVGPPGYLWLGQDELHDPVLRADAARELRAQLRQLGSDSAFGRSLLSTRARDSLYRRGLAAHVLGSLAMVLTADGQPAPARDTIDIAIRFANGMCGFEYLYERRAAADLALNDSTSGASDLAASKLHPSCGRDWAKP